MHCLPSHSDSTDDTACATHLCCFVSVEGYVQLLGQGTTALLYTDESGSVSIVPKTHQLRRNLIFNSNFGEGGTNSGYCVDWDNASSEYNATDNVRVFGGFKLSGGSNRAVSGNLVVDGKLVDPQQAECCPTPAEQAKVLSINTTTVFGNTAVHLQGAFYSCA